MLPMAFASAAASALAVALAMQVTPAQASFTTMDIASDVNANLLILPSSYPTGTSSGNQATGIPFDVATYAGSNAGFWIAGGAGSLTGGAATSLTVSLTGLNLTGERSFYALLNNYNGTPNADEYTIVVSATNGDTVTYQSIGGVDTRDYNQNLATSNSIANSTAPWYENGNQQRLDVREFTLPSSFASETLQSFTIQQVVIKDSAIFGGLTFSTAPPVVLVPEPPSYTLYGCGVGLLCLMASRKLRQS